MLKMLLQSSVLGFIDVLTFVTILEFLFLLTRGAVGAGLMLHGGPIELFLITASSPRLV